MEDEDCEVNNMYEEEKVDKSLIELMSPSKDDPNFRSIQDQENCRIEIASFCDSPYMLQVEQNLYDFDPQEINLGEQNPDLGLSAENLYGSLLE